MNLLDQLFAYIPVNEQEASDKEEMIRWLGQGSDLFTRANRAAHFTASAWVVSPDRKYVLMAYHNLYNSWAWLGGHADGEQDLLKVAIKEATEETGVRNVRIVTPDILSVEILTVDGHEKKGSYVSSHLHLNVTYLLEADMEESLEVKPDENSAVGWIHVDEINRKSTETWFKERIYSKLIQKVNTMNQ